MSGKVQLNTVKAGDTIQLGPFKVEFFHISHSIPDAVGLGITSPAGLVVHTSDFKFDMSPVDGWPTDYAKLAEFSHRGVDLLLSDSTNAERPGWTPSEMVIGPAFDKVMNDARGRVIIATFASLISRIQQVADAAARHGRKMALAGPSMLDNVKIARNLGYLNIDDSLLVPHRSGAQHAGPQGGHHVHRVAGRAFLHRGSSFNRHQPAVRPQTGRHGGAFLAPHPGQRGNDQQDDQPAAAPRCQGHLRRDPAVHVPAMRARRSRNCSQPGEAQALPPYPRRVAATHASRVLAEEVGMSKEDIIVVENGQIVELSGGNVRLGERIPGDYIFVDGESIGDIDHGVMRERELLARNGILLIDISLDKLTKRLLHEPEILTRGYVSPQDAEALIPEVRKRVMEVVNGGGLENEKDIISAVKSYLHEVTKRRPMVFVTLSKA